MTSDRGVHLCNQHPNQDRDAYRSGWLWGEGINGDKWFGQCAGKPIFRQTENLPSRPAWELWIRQGPRSQSEWWPRVLEKQCVPAPTPTPWSGTVGQPHALRLCELRRQTPRGRWAPNLQWRTVTMAFLTWWGRPSPGRRGQSSFSQCELSVGQQQDCYERVTRAG